MRLRMLKNPGGSILCGISPTFTLVSRLMSSQVILEEEDVRQWSDGVMVRWARRNGRCGEGGQIREIGGSSADMTAVNLIS